MADVSYVLNFAAGVVLVSILGAGGDLSAQQRPSFEVSTIIPTNPNNSEVALHSTNRKFSFTNYTVKRLIAFAYGVEEFQVSGGPAWVNSQGYDITAKVPDELAAKRDSEDNKAMVQSLLSDRFKLTTHTEMRELPVYALVIAKNGSKLEISKPTTGRTGLTGSREGGRIRWVFTDVPLSLFAHRLSQGLGRPVLDRTNLTAQYDFKLEWTPDQNPIPSQTGDLVRAVPADSGPSLFEALQEQLGLKLESQRGPVEIFVIDNVKKPEDN